MMNQTNMLHFQIYLTFGKLSKLCVSDQGLVSNFPKWANPIPKWETRPEELYS